MQTTRLQKIERLIQKDMGQILLNHSKTMQGLLVSVSEVRVSPDLSIAHIFLSIFPDNKEYEFMRWIRENKSKLRGELGNIERHQLRIIPELNFHLDQTIERMEHIDQLLKQ